MATNFIFVSILFGILFISLDLVYFYFHKRNYSIHKRLTFILTTYFYRLKARFRNLTTFRSKPGFKEIPSNLVMATHLAAEPSENNTVPTENKTLIINSETAALSSANNPHILSSPEPTPETTNHPDTDRLVHTQITADIPEGTAVYITIRAERGQGQVTLQKAPQPFEFSQEQPALPRPEKTADQPISRIRKFFTQHPLKWNHKPTRLVEYLLLAALVIYALVESIGIDRFPIYFFSDEAIHMNLASNFLRDGFRNYSGELFPTFFISEGWVNGTSVYLQVLPLVLFGKSVIVTRMVSMLVSLLGALAVGLLLKDIFKLRYYWAGIFMVLTTPAWFLHARTAFEYVEVASFYSIFLYFYSRYRAGHLRSFYWAIIAACLTFYTHGLGEILIGVSCLAFFIIDFRYHIHPDRRKTILYGIFLGAVLLLPYARYLIDHPGESVDQLKRRGSYWVDGNLNLLQKLGDFFKQYIYGLSPSYWYFKNPVDIDRHIMDGYGNGLWYTIPFLAIGLYQAIKNIRLPSYRIILISLLVCPIPASVVAIGMPRMLWMTIPIAILSTIGLVTLLQWFESRWHFRFIWLTTGLFIVLTSLSFYMLRDALVNGPTWFQDYSLYGMQYGAKQVFQDVVRVGLEQDPNRRYIVSPSWANGTDQFVDFFIPTALQSRINMGQPIDLIDDLRKATPDMYFVATSDEYDKLLVNPKFKDITVSQILFFPNGKPGFYVITLKVVDNIDAIISSENAKNRTPVEDTISLNGQSVRIVHSPLGSGRLEDIFDNNPDTLARVLEANPFTLDLYPTKPITTNSIVIQTGSLEKFTVNISLYALNSSEPVTYTRTYSNLPPDPLVDITFDKGPVSSARIYIEVKDDLSGDTSQIHIRTIQFK